MIHQSPNPNKFNSVAAQYLVLADEKHDVGIIMADRMGRTSRSSLRNSNLSGADCCGDNAKFDHWGNYPSNPYDGNGSKPYTDPKQGCINDCWFIAALVSIALSSNSKLRTHPKYRFYDIIKKAWSAEFEISLDLPLTLNNNLVYARSASQYIWPCLYEKAYAVWHATAYPVSGENPNKPDYNNHLNGGLGENGLLAIVGGTLGPSKTMPTFDPLGKPNKPTIARKKLATGVMHDYSVVKKFTASNQTWYKLRDPCGGGFIDITQTDLNTYVEWRYVTPV